MPAQRALLRFDMNMWIEQKKNNHNLNEEWITSSSMFVEQLATWSLK